MVILTDENGVKTYHRPNCKHLIDNINSINIDGVYTKLQIANSQYKKLFEELIA